MEITLWDPGSERLLNVCVCILTGKAGRETWLFILMLRCISLCRCFLEPSLYGGMPSLGGYRKITKVNYPIR